MINESLREVVLMHAQNSYPQESCGLVAILNGRERYFACNNIALDKTKNFEIDAKDYVRVSEQAVIVGVVHSHPDQPTTPSEADIAACERSGLIWWIVNHKTEQISEVVPQNRIPSLYGRDYVHGIFDCYTFIQDYFKQTHNIVLGDYVYPAEFWKHGMNLYVDHFQEQGFVEVDRSQMRPGNCLLLAIDSPIANHAAVITDDGVISHHLRNRLSSKDVLSQYYRDRIIKVVRHESMV